MAIEDFTSLAYPEILPDEQMDMTVGFLARPIARANGERAYTMPCPTSGEWNHWLPRRVGSITGEGATWFLVVLAPSSPWKAWIWRSWVVSDLAPWAITFCLREKRVSLSCV